MLICKVCEFFKILIVTVLYVDTETNFFNQNWSVTNFVNWQVFFLKYKFWKWRPFRSPLQNRASESCCSSLSQTLCCLRLITVYETSDAINDSNKYDIKNFVLFLTQKSVTYYHLRIHNRCLYGNVMSELSVSSKIAHHVRSTRLTFTMENPQVGDRL